MCLYISIWCYDCDKFHSQVRSTTDTNETGTRAQETKQMWGSLRAGSTHTFKALPTAGTRDEETGTYIKE
jgi:hypothetical protein